MNTRCRQTVIESPIIFSTMGRHDPHKGELLEMRRLTSKDAEVQRFFVIAAGSITEGQYQVPILAELRLWVAKEVITIKNHGLAEQDAATVHLLSKTTLIAETSVLNSDK